LTRTAAAGTVVHPPVPTRDALGERRGIVAERFRTFYDKHLNILTDQDHVRLIDEQYDPQAQLLNIDHPPAVIGRAALKAHFAAYLATLGYLKVLSTDKYVESDDSLMFEATVETAGGVARVYDVFLMRDGRIWRHYTGLLGFTPKTA
jgi:hypothetical protein